MRLNNGNCAIPSMQIDMRIYTVAETKTPYFKRDYSLCDFVAQAHKSIDFVGAFFNEICSLRITS